MGSIDSTAFRLNPEIKREAWEYAHRGDVVHDVYWDHLGRLYRADPVAFTTEHPNVVGYFDRPVVLWMQPRGPILDDLRHRYELDPARFTFYHNFWGEIFSLEPTSVPPQPPGVPPVLTPPVTTPGGTLPPPVGQGAVPEPSSCVLMGIAMIFLFLAMWRKR